MHLNLDWVKCEGGRWCNLLNLNLGHEHFNDMEGVYVIWHASQNPATVRVGQGFIRDRLVAHREDSAILAYQQYGLYVTWARVAAVYRDGVERYLAAALKPKVGSRFPEAVSIEVNLPR